MLPKIRTPYAGVCKECGMVLNKAINMRPEIDREQPQEGDVAICGRCGSMWVTNEKGSLRHPTLDDILRIPGSELDKIGELTELIKKRRAETNAEKLN